MKLIEEHNKRYDFFRVVTGEAMKVHSKLYGGLADSFYLILIRFCRISLRSRSKYLITR